MVYIPQGQAQAYNPNQGQPVMDPQTLPNAGFVNFNRHRSGNDAQSANQQTLTDQISNQAIHGLSTQLPTYDGPGVPGVNQTQQNVFDAAQGLQNRGINTQPAIQQQLNAGADPAAVQEYYRNAVELPSQQGFRDTMNMIGERYGSNYGQSGGMLRQMGGAANDYQTNLSGQLADLQFNERNAAFDRNNQGIQNAFGEMQAFNQNLGTQSALGAEQRGIQGQENAGEHAIWQAAQPWANPYLDMAGMALNTNAVAPKGPSDLETGLQTAGLVTNIIGGIYGGLS
jgi:hypothetical protein